jgi:hypothetical protein
VQQQALIARIDDYRQAYGIWPNNRRLG